MKHTPISIKLITTNTSTLTVVNELQHTLISCKSIAAYSKTWYIKSSILQIQEAGMLITENANRVAS